MVLPSMVASQLGAKQVESCSTTTLSGLLLLLLLLLPHFLSFSLQVPRPCLQGAGSNSAEWDSIAVASPSLTQSADQPIPAASCIYI